MLREAPGSLRPGMCVTHMTHQHILDLSRTWQTVSCTGNEMDVFDCLSQILVLGFCDSQRDLEVVQKILSQVRHLNSSRSYD